MAGGGPQGDRAVRRQLRRHDPVADLRRDRQLRTPGPTSSRSRPTCAGWASPPGTTAAPTARAAPSARMLNMKRVWQGVNQDTAAAWRPQLEVWGQESGHRWMMFMGGARSAHRPQSSDALLGRDCSHYSRFVDTQGSVHDGLAWTDNRDGTFSAGLRPHLPLRQPRSLRHGPAARPTRCRASSSSTTSPATGAGACGQYASTPKPLQNKISGTRVEVTDRRHRGGQRAPRALLRRAAGGRPPGLLPRGAGGGHPGRASPPAAPWPARWPQRIDRARLLWEQWMRAATGNRMVVCTQVSRDCGDPRSDVVDLRFNPAGRSPTWGPLAVEVDRRQPGPARGDRGRRWRSRPRSRARPPRPVAGGRHAGRRGPAGRPRSSVDLRGHPCGSRGHRQGHQPERLSLPPPAAAAGAGRRGRRPGRVREPTAAGG